MKNGTTTLQDLRQMADELELQLHLASMEARDRWRALQPQLAELEDLLAQSGKRASAAVERQLSTLASALRQLRDEVVASLKN